MINFNIIYFYYTISYLYSCNCSRTWYFTIITFNIR